MNLNIIKKRLTIGILFLVSVLLNFKNSASFLYRQKEILMNIGDFNLTGVCDLVISPAFISNISSEIQNKTCGIPILCFIKTRVRSQLIANR